MRQIPRRQRSYVLAVIDGARRLALPAGVPRHSTARFHRHREICAAAATIDDDDPNDMNHDTVGCVVIDATGTVAAGVSSGGISLKWPGRVGEAAISGAGVWAVQGGGEPASPSVGVSCSGTGEQIMRVLLAQRAAGVLSAPDHEEDLDRNLRQLVRDPAAVAFGSDEPALGLVALVENAGIPIMIEMHIAHSTPSMGVAVWDGRKSHFVLSRRRPGAHCAVQSMSLGAAAPPSQPSTPT
ncbi:nucleophile aminohydrolase [Blastocladiella britannica]|nr:nucleophile aminohydrolase [Blastocladiella britannica]